MQLSNEVIDALTALLDVVLWPVVVLTVALLFRRALRDLLIGDEVSVTGPSGVSITSKRGSAATRALIQASRHKDSWAFIGPRGARRQVAMITHAVDRLGRNPRVLWVDDRPSNNRYERAAMERMGVRVKQVTSTDIAMQELAPSGEAYDVVITDMGRPPTADAGYDLLDRLRAAHNQIPVAIYAASRRGRHFDEAVAKGALGCTNRTDELLTMLFFAFENAQQAEATGAG